MRILLAVFLIINSYNLFAQASVVSGYIYDESNGEYLYGATVFDTLSKVGTSSNSYGFFSLKLSEPNAFLRFSFLGYENKIIEINKNDKFPISIYLTPSITNMKEILILSNSNDIENGDGLSKMVLNARTMRSVPALGSIPDPIKVIQLLPGISRGVEGSSDFFVRGGSPDQNLILLDGITVYNPSHLLGFISVFNPDAIQNIEIIKGEFPARYGGRLSSVLDIQLKEGNKKNFNGSFTMGLLSTHLHMEGPLNSSENTSFLLAVRRSNIDLYAGALRQLTGENIASIGFYDVNAKVMHRFNEKQKLFLSYYSGRDSYNSKFSRSSFEDEFGIKWGNHTASMRWNAQVSARTFLNLTFGYTSYDFGVDSNSNNRRSTVVREISEYSYKTKIEDLVFKLDFDSRINHWNTFRYGINLTFHQFQPSVVDFSLSVNDDIVNEGQFRDVDITSRESYLYFEEEIKLGRLLLNTGMNLSNFSVRGTNYFSIQPRISSIYKFQCRLVKDQIGL